MSTERKKNAAEARCDALNEIYDQLYDLGDALLRLSTCYIRGTKCGAKVRVYARKQKKLQKKMSNTVWKELKAADDNLGRITKDWLYPRNT